ncbi:MAG TPA: hypothetical protein V6C57_18050 [Coleofasciculaceae cyanobacterium]
MEKTTSDLVKIIEAGGSLVIEAERSTSDLIKLAQTANRVGTRLVLRKVSKTTLDVIMIARAGGSNVILELE